MRRAAVLAALAPLALATACSGNPSALEPRGRGAREIAALWWLLLAAGTAVMVLVVVLLLAVVWRRRPAPEGGAEGAERAGRRWLLWGGVVLPVVVLVPLSFVTLRTMQRLSAAGADGTLEIDVVGHQFWWEVRYPGSAAVTANEIHVPAGRDVRLRLASADVIHSLWVPNLHGKVDLVPGESTSLVVNADEPGTYRGLCAEFCGIQHAHMQFLVVAHRPAEFERWLAREASGAAAPASHAERAGAAAFQRVGCASCHAVRGTPAAGRAGPDLTHVGSRRTLGAGTVANTRGNLGGWIADPQRIKPGNRMPPSVLDAEELKGLIAYLESLR